MNFKNLSKEKKNQLVLVGVITVALLVGLGYGLIRFQLQYVKDVEAKKLEADRKLKTMVGLIKAADTIQGQVTAATQELAAQEAAMVKGDKLTWLNTTIKAALKQHPKLDATLSTYQEDDCTILARFPYTQVLIQLSGTGHFHDIGQFISDFENQQPLIRVLNVELESSSAAALGEKEKMERLGFKLFIAALVKPT